MKKKITLTLIATACIAAMAFCLVACVGNGSLTKLSKQSDILTELRSKTADIGIMDSIMAERYVSLDTNKDLMIVKDLKLTDEKYGIAFRKGSAGMVDKVNVALTELSKDGTMATIAQKYNVANAVVPFDYVSKWDSLTAADKADYEAIKAKGELVLGYTIFEPIAYTDANKKLVGYDIEIAEKVCAKLGLTLKPQEINWDTKVIELNSNGIDCIWNGMTITEDIKAGCAVTVPYLNNAQVALIRIADAAKYTKDLKSFKGAKIVAEAGSAGALAYEEKIAPLFK